MELTYPGNDTQCWMPGCHKPRIQPGDGPHDGGTRSWKVCLAHFVQLVLELHEALGWNERREEVRS